MPQFQLLPMNLSFGSQLGQRLGEGLSEGIGQNIGQFFQQRQNRRALEGLRPFYQEAGLPEEEFEQFTRSGLSPELAVGAIKIGASQRAKQEQGLSNKHYSGILDQLEDMANQDQVGTVNYAASFFSPELRENAAKFDSLALSTLGLAQKVALKAGIRNQREFDQFIKRTVPNSHDNVRTIKGKIDALREYLEQEDSPQISRPSVEEGDFVMMKDPQGKVRKVPKSRAMEFQKAGGKIVQ